MGGKKLRSSLPSLGLDDRLDEEVVDEALERSEEVRGTKVAPMLASARRTRLQSARSRESLQGQRKCLRT